MAQAHRDSSALCYGDYTSLVLTNRQIIFQRRCDTERVIVAVNADSQSYVAHFDAQSGQGKDLITGQLHDFGGGSTLPPYSVSYWQTER